MTRCTIRVMTDGLRPMRRKAAGDFDGSIILTDATLGEFGPCGTTANLGVVLIPWHAIRWLAFVGEPADTADPVRELLEVVLDGAVLDETGLWVGDGWINVPQHLRALTRTLIEEATDGS